MLILNQSKEAAEVFIAGREFAQLRLNEILKIDGQPGEHTAEIDTLRVLRAQPKLTQHEIELLKSAVYGVDDSGEASLEFIKSGYDTLAKHTHLREKHFYKKESKGVAGRIAVKEFFKHHPNDVLMGAPVRRDRRHKRPPILLPSQQ